MEDALEIGQWKWPVELTAPLSNLILSLKVQYVGILTFKSQVELSTECEGK